MVDPFLPMDNVENARHSYLTLNRLIDRLEARQVDVADLNMLKLARDRIVARWPEITTPPPKRTALEARLRNIIYNFEQDTGVAITRLEVIRLLRNSLGMEEGERP